MDLTNRSQNVFQMTKSCWLKNPLLWEKKNRLCRNNNNNNLHFVILGAPHIEVSRKGNGKKLHASCSMQNLALDSIPWHRQLQLPASSSVTAILSIYFEVFAAVKSPASLSHVKRKKALYPQPCTGRAAGESAMSLRCSLYCFPTTG